MGSKLRSDDEVFLEDARLSFNDLWTPKAFEPGQKEKFSATLILDPSTKAGKEALSILKQAHMNVVKAAEGWKGQMPKNAKNWLVCHGEDKLTGAGEVRPEYEGMYIVSAKSDKRPLLVDRDGTPLAEEDGKLYSGCRVNVILRVYAVTQKNPCISGQLKGIQFLRDDERFGSGGLEADAFENLDTDDMRAADASKEFFPDDDITF